ncbi:MAG: ester cyclase [Pseudomonadota bacterium]
MSRNYGPAQPLARHHMPRGYDVSFREYSRHRTVRIPEDYGPKQLLRGFEPDYANIVDYIVRITHRIWESDPPEVEYIADCYGPTSLIYDDYGLQTGNKKIIADTHHTTGAFPDIILDAEEIIWAGDDEVGFHTSHLTRIMGTNTGPSRYGAATGKQVNVLVIANCVALSNDIFLEHVLYNTSAMLQQLGIDLWEEADRLASDPPAGWPRSQKTWDDLRKSAAPAQPLALSEPVDGFDPDQFARWLHDNTWNGDMSAIDTYYAQKLPFEGTTQRQFEGTAAYKEYIQNLRSAFPNLSLQVDEVYWMGNEQDGWLISTRWSAEATHSGDTDTYRTATEAACQIWGITQWRVQDGRVEQEWQLFNELDLMMQIAKARQDAS